MHPVHGLQCVHPRSDLSVYKDGQRSPCLPGRNNVRTVVLRLITAIIIRVAIRDEWYLRISKLGAIRFRRRGRGRSFHFYHHTTHRIYYARLSQLVHLVAVACPSSLQIAQVTAQTPLVSNNSNAQMRYRQCSTDRLLINNWGSGMRLSTLAESDKAT